MTSVDSVLVAAQRASALSFSTFLVVHLSAPLAAAYGGEHVASELQVFGRVWYQGGAKELVIVWGSLGVHIISGILKRAWRIGRRVKRRAELERQAQEALEDAATPASVAAHYKRQSRGAEGWRAAMPRSLHTLTGYILVPLVAAHSATHRIIPSRTSANGQGAISPAFLSYAYVSRNLILNPLSASLGYAALVVLATYHAAAGFRIISSRGKKKAKLGSDTARIAWVTAVSAVGLGVLRLKQDGKDVPAFLIKQYDVVLRGR